MADDRREEENEEFQNVFRSRNSAERTERTKLECLNSSQGPLSSIRAAFKRRGLQSQVNSSGPRRRPEITIVSVEPLPATSWFTGASGGFQQHPLLRQPAWDGSVSLSDQAPPSYDQVIREKTQEQEEATPPTPLPRQSLTNSTATQTDSVEEETTRPAAAHAPVRGASGDLLEKPRKPPRPSLPKPKTTAKGSGAAVDTEPPTRPHPDPRTPTHHKPGPSQPNTVQSASVLVSTDFCDRSSAQLQASETSNKPRPVPRPRSKPKAVSNDLQPLVQLKDRDPVPSLENDTGLSGPYLKELLEAFGSDPPLDPTCSVAKQEDQNTQGGEDLVENMTALHNDRNIRARIQAFERQNGPDEPGGVPSPRPRNIYTKAPVAAPKPSVAPRPSVSRPAEEEAAAQENYYEDINIMASSITSGTVQPPAPAPKPLPPRKPSIGSKEEFRPPVKTTPLLPSRPSLNRSKNVSSQDEPVVFKVPPTPVKPNRDLLNMNNHNSTGLLLNATQSLVENEYVDFPSSNPPATPTYGGPFSTPALNTQPISTALSTQPISTALSTQPISTALSTQPISRRPTVIRVPSTSNKYEPRASDLVQGAVGGATPVANKLTNWDPFGVAAEPALPPRPGGGRVPPARPPPARAGLDRPPQPRSFQQAPLQQGVLQRPPSQMQHRPSRTPSKKSPVLPPRPNPGHRLYNNYTLQIPHGIAQFDCNGTRTGDLSFQKNEVLVLLNQIDGRTFECQAGDAKGTVQDSYMKIITPLSQYSEYADNPVPQESSSMQVQALYDFTPEGQGELALKAGDIVSNVEQLDTEWYLGTCRGARGFFPINYAKLVSGPPTPTVAPTNERRAQQSAATVSGPRCVARFDFEGEQTDELSFYEGDVIRLQEYLGEDWARGEIGGHVGIFPLNFVDVVEDLPPAVVPSHGRVALPGMTNSHSVQAAPPPSQANARAAEWAVALYDFTAETEEDLPLRQGDMILVTAHIDEEWCSGRLNGREGLFPAAFIQPCSGS
ncbi:SH3 domain-containing protein 19 isoform X2 [Brachyhypopomus gauderio]|uniref:SH3 domain-containing protein 19 isoform X2 n=1 Tax=Brachyhypopomus gauderio TaxID=698409 RepID=UPI004042687F